MTKRLILRIFAAISLLVATTIVLLLGGVGVSYAAENKYSNVLDDLRKDESFDLNAYPNVDGDYSLQVIQIAESTDGELFLYVYQPAAHEIQLTATAVNMALSDFIGVDDNQSSGQAGGGHSGGGSSGRSVDIIDNTTLYALTLLSREGVLQKYRVEGVKVSSDEVRYYNITCLYRDWIKGIDGESGNDNTIDGVPCEVGKIYESTTIGGDIVYKEPVDVVKILNPFTKYIRYYDNTNVWYQGANDAHFIAFSTDKKIDDLLEADVSYCYRSVHKYHKFAFGNVTDYGTLQTDGYAYLTKDQSVYQEPKYWLFLKKEGYDYSRIQSSSEFLKNEENVAEDVRSEIAKTEWVLRFLETSYTNRDNGHDGDITYTDVFQVTVLRLKFRTGDKIYNLGAVSNRVTGNHEPANSKFDFWQWLANLLGVPVPIAKLIVYGVAALIVLAIALPILSLVFPVFGQFLKWLLRGFGSAIKYLFIGLWTVIKYLFIGIWWVISLPFRGIIVLVRKIRGD